MENVKKPPPKKKPFYSLAEVKQCLANGCFQVNPDCRLDALADFGWSIDEVAAALLSLKESMFYDHGVLKHKPHVVIDKYRCPLLHDGESVYTHFYIDDDTGTLVINSFKRL